MPKIIILNDHWSIVTCGDTTFDLWSRHQRRYRHYLQLQPYWNELGLRFFNFICVTYVASSTAYCDIIIIIIIIIYYSTYLPMCAYIHTMYVHQVRPRSVVSTLEVLQCWWVAFLCISIVFIARGQWLAANARRLVQNNDPFTARWRETV